MLTNSGNKTILSFCCTNKVCMELIKCHDAMSHMHTHTHQDRSRSSERLQWIENEAISFAIIHWLKHYQKGVFLRVIFWFRVGNVRKDNGKWASEREMKMNARSARRMQNKCQKNNPYNRNEFIQMVDSDAILWIWVTRACDLPLSISFRLRFGFSV